MLYKRGKHLWLFLTADIRDLWRRNEQVRVVREIRILRAKWWGWK
jgi:hypothetical protein